MFPTLPQKAHITAKPRAVPPRTSERGTPVPPHPGPGELSEAPEGPQRPAPEAAHQNKELRARRENKASPDVKWDSICSLKDDTHGPFPQSSLQTQEGGAECGEVGLPEASAARPCEDLWGCMEPSPLPPWAALGQLRESCSQMKLINFPYEQLFSFPSHATRYYKWKAKHK